MPDWPASTCSGGSTPMAAISSPPAEDRSTEGRATLNHRPARSPATREACEPMATEAYCVKCKAKREMQNENKITMKNGKPATEGTCPVCGTKMFRIGG